MSLSDVISRLKSKFYRMTNMPIYISNKDLRSASDDGYYPEFALRVALNAKLFSNFKRDPIYRRVLEHVSEDQGIQYIEEIRKKWPELLKDIEQHKVNDLVGNPIRYSYPNIGAISPTTLRYLKVASDLRDLFGDLKGMNIAEIGAGYGGQFLLADQLWDIGSWTHFDLDPVLQLTSRYLESHMVKSTYRRTTLNRFDERSAQFDLAISNYAFSELPRALQLSYIHKVLRRTLRGYMTMNSGKTAAGDGERLTIVELRQHFPSLRVLAEVPLTGPENYILVWGD